MKNDTPLRRTVRFAPDHPVFAGHYPGNPVAPAALILREVIATVRAARGDAVQVSGIPAAKFIAPLRPAETLVVEVVIGDGSLVAFRCIVADRLIAEGEIALADRVVQ